MKAELEALIEQMIAGGILFEEAVQEFEKQFILNMMARNKQNLSKAADALGIHRNTLSKRVKEYENRRNGHANGNGQAGKNSSKRRQVAQRRKTRQRPIPDPV